MSETTSVQAIASQVRELADTQVLVVRLSEGLTTTGPIFRNFAAEMRAILGEEMGGRKTESLNWHVL